MLYPELNLLSLDFDSGVSSVNVTNRLLLFHTQFKCLKTNDYEFNFNHRSPEDRANRKYRIAYYRGGKTRIYKKGFEQTSMSDIAAVVGINRPTLHYYFRTKDKMFQAVFASIVAKFLPHIDTIFSTQQSFSEKLEDVIDVYVSIFSTNPLLPKFIIGEIQRDANHLIETFYSLNLDQYLKHIGEFLEKEMESGNFKKVPLPLYS